MFWPSISMESGLEYLAPPTAHREIFQSGGATRRSRVSAPATEVARMPGARVAALVDAASFGDGLGAVLEQPAVATAAAIAPATASLRPWFMVRTRHVLLCIQRPLLRTSRLGHHGAGYGRAKDWQGSGDGQLAPTAQKLMSLPGGGSSTGGTAGAAGYGVPGGGGAAGQGVVPAPIAAAYMPRRRCASSLDTISLPKGASA